MPYNKVSDLPNNVKNPLPSAAQKLWMRVFNAALRSCQSNGGKKCEDVARIAAWAQVKSKYKKGKNGKWTRKKND